MEKGEIVRLVLTGGPCSGKTTCLNYISEKLRNMGFKILFVPEVATDRMNSGIDIAGAPQDLKNLIQEQMLYDQIVREDAYYEYARMYADYYGSKVIMLCDRGAMDYVAYAEPNFIYSALEEKGLNIVSLRDRRYLGVFHLASVACDFEELYTSENNLVRYEDAAGAREADRRIREAWIGHPHFRVIRNETEFEKKLQRLFQAICQALGIPVPLEMERKFLLRHLPESFPVAVRKVEIEQIYLQPSGGELEVRIRKRCQDGHFVCYRTEKKMLTAVTRVEKETQISPREYVFLKSRRDPNKEIIQKERYCFLWKDQYFELDVFINPRTDFYLLEVELTEENDAVEIPDFLEIEREVTGDPEFLNSRIALRK